MREDLCLPDRPGGHDANECGHWKDTKPPAYHLGAALRVNGKGWRCHACVRTAWLTGRCSPGPRPLAVFFMRSECLARERKEKLLFLECCVELRRIMRERKGGAPSDVISCSPPLPLPSRRCPSFASSVVYVDHLIAQALMPPAAGRNNPSSDRGVAGLVQ